jgi:PST family polysaccharide transporter
MIIKCINQEEYFITERFKTDLKGQAMRGAGITLFAQFLSFFIHFARTIILARLLTPNDFGLIAMITTFSLLFESFGVTGFSESIIQKDDLDHKKMSTLFWLNASISLFLTFLFMTAAPFFVWFYQQPHLSFITIGIALSIIANGMAMTHLALLRRNMQFYTVTYIRVVSEIICVALAILLALSGFGYWALVANAVVWPTLLAAGGWIFCRWRPGPPGAIKDIIPMIKFGMHTYGNFMLNYFSRNIDKLLIGWQLGAQSLGYYKKAYDLFAMPASQLITPLNSVALATLSRLRNDPIKYQHYYMNVLNIIAFIGMPLSAILTLTGEDIILLVLGPQWVKAGAIFCYFGASIGIMLIQGTRGWLHLSLGKPDRWFRWSVFETIILTVFFVVGLAFGINGVAIAYTLSFYILCLPSLVYAGKPINIALSSILSSIWRYSSAALVSGLLTFAVLYKFGHIGFAFRDLHVAPRILIASTICFLLYLILVIIFYQSLSPIKQFFSVAYQMLPGRMQKKQS